MKGKSILTYMAGYKKESILAPLFKMLEACFELLIPLLVADIIDTGIKSGQGYILQRGIFMILFGIVGFGFSITAQYFAAKSAIGVSQALRKDLFYHISSLSYKELDNTGTTALITGMTSDVNQVQNGVNWFLRLFLRSPFIVIGAAIMASLINGMAALIFWGTIGVLILIIVLIMRSTNPLNAKVQEQLESVTTSFRENLLGVRVVRAFNRQKMEKEQFDRRHEELFKRQLRVGRVSSLLNPLTFAVINFAIILVLYSGGIQVNIGNLSQGQVIALLNYMSQILTELIKFANVVIVVSKAIASYKRIQKLFAIQPSLKGGEKKLACGSSVDIKLEDLCYSYSEGGENALEHISCHIPAGAHVGIIGATGSGKTTLINLINRFYERSAGKILLNDVPVEDYSLSSLTDSIALVPQKAVLFKGTLRSNLKWGNKSATDEECLSALEDSCALDFVQEKGQGLELSVEQSGRNFSGGQRQRLTIARALMQNCSLLILDDSYSALDYATEAHIKKSVFTNKENCTVLTVSQRVSSIYASDMILVLDNGTLAGCGTHNELLESCPVYREICQSQNFNREVSAS